MPCVDAGHKARRDVFDVALGACQLSREVNTGFSFCRQCRKQRLECVDVRIPVDLAQSQKLRILKPEDQLENTALLAELEMILKTHDVVARLHENLLPQLDDRVR